jgi:mono/diheme cytochrome c family protein
MDGFLSIDISSHFTPAFARARSAPPRSLLRAATIAVALAVAPLVLAEARAQALDPADIAAGMRLFRQTGGCQLCHGWAGDGRKMDNQSHGSA